MHVFLFDIDGTLIRSGGAGQASLREAMRTEFGVDDPEDVPVHGFTDRVIASSLFERHGFEDSFENWQRLINSYLRLLPKLLAEKDGEVLPGVTSVLESLSAREDVAVGLLTGNVPRGAQIKLEHFGLYHHFTFGGYGEDHHNRNDVATAALAAAKDHLNGQVSLDRTFVIGDTPNDIRCAHHIGAKAIGVCTGIFSADDLKKENPNALLDDMSDSQDILTFVD